MNRQQIFFGSPLGLALAVAGLGLLPLAISSAYADMPASPAAAGTRPLDTRMAPRLASDAAFDLPPVAGAEHEPRASGAAGTVRHIAFRGNRAVTRAALEAVAAPWLNRALAAADIEQLRQAVTRFYVDQGYVNSGAVLAADALRGDTLTLDIIEGRVVAIRLKGLARLNENYVVDRLVEDEAEVLNVEQLRERFQRLLEDPLFDRMNARLMPGNQLGEAILDIDAVRARPYSLSLSANNYRPPSVGEYALNVNGGVRNLTGQGDQLELGLQQAEGGPGRGSLSWQMPLGAKGPRLSLQFDHGRSSVIEEPLSVLDIQSTLDSKDIGLSQVVHETLRDRLSLGVHRVWRENRTELLGMPFSFVPGEPDGVTRTRSWRFWQEYTHRTEKDALALRSTFTWVRNNLQGGGAQSPNHYTVWLGQAQYARQISASSGTQLVVRGTLQTSHRHLLALDQLAIGGVSTVRGYRENLMLRDTGAVFNVEIDHPLIRHPGNGLNLSMIPFYDHGHARNRNEAGDSVSSVGLALRNRWQGVFVDLAVAHRLISPETVKALKGSLQDKSVHLQVGYRFF